MKRTIFLGFISFFLFFSFPLFAKDEQGTWTKLTMVSAWHNGFYIVPEVRDSFNCQDTSMYVVKPSSTKVDWLVPALLSAFEQGKQVQFTVRGCYRKMPRIVGIVVN